MEVTNFPTKKEIREKMLPDVNIGLVGHVDHGKTTLTEALTGKWTDTHSEELKRGITIRLGYADATFYKCKCGFYSHSKKCPKCFSDCEAIRSVSFIDAPGHETLMATVLSGTALMDGALLVIAANEKCPQPQTAEHLKALEIANIKNLIIVQNKIDIVSEEDALENYKQIKEFVKGTIAEGAPIIPISAQQKANIDILIKTILERIPKPKRDLSKNPKFLVARSFDVNKPGTKIKDLKGGVIGGSLVSGILKVGDEIEIRPGIRKNDEWTSLKTKIVSIQQGQTKLEEGEPGGLIALGTELDPSLTKSDSLVGNVVGHVDKLPPVIENMKLSVNLFDYVIGVSGQQKVEEIKTGDVLMITVTIAKSVGVVTSSHRDKVEIKLKIPICADIGDKVAISKQVDGRWHLIGWGIIE